MQDLGTILTVAFSALLFIVWVWAMARLLWQRFAKARTTHAKVLAKAKNTYLRQGKKKEAIEHTDHIVYMELRGKKQTFFAEEALYDRLKKGMEGTLYYQTNQIIDFKPSPKGSSKGREQ